jgi:phenylpropionate dioxygenase-like ring-hydroxylating dioxygenase large terminal subunit
MRREQTVQQVTPVLRTQVETPVEKAPEPDLGAQLIPKERYISTDFMALEWAHMWTKCWLVGCREDEIPEPGDYITTDIGPESLLIARGEDGKARVFYNVCNHRGNQVKFDDCGHAKTLKCAYHSWEYDLTGRLIHVPDEEDFTQGCPPDQLSLTELNSDVWGGFVWFCQDPDGGSLRDYLGVIPQHLDAYEFDKMAMTMNVTVEWDCNWKTSVDAFNEVYHTHCIHPELSYQHDDINLQIDLFERHSRYLIPFQVPSPRVMDKVNEVPEAIAMEMRDLGMDPAEFDGRVGDVRRAYQIHKRATAEAKGYDYSRLSDDQLSDDFHYMIFPNITMNIFADSLLFFRQRPHETDPNKMYYDVQTFSRPKNGRANRPVPGREQFRHGDRSLGLVLDQDSVNLPHVQKGMNSVAYKGLWISHQERRIRHMHQTLMDYISADS